MKKQVKFFLVLLLFPLLFSLFLTPIYAYATEETTNHQKKYGILIADKNGTYTWYDLNNTLESSCIEITNNNKIMLPAWKFASLIPELKYSYNKTTKLLTITNTYNGRKITCKLNSTTCDYYANEKAKAITKEMPYQMYISKTSKAVMISADTMKWLMNITDGYKYYKPEAMQSAGYDTYSYSALFVYNPYNKITELPIATKVKSLSTTIKVTIPEGYSVAQTFELLVKKGVCASIEDLFLACESYDYSYYPLIAALETNENRCFRLEGYLFPDTYEFYRLSKAQDAIGRFLRNAEIKITEDIRNKAKEMGYTINEILTIASIVEKEIHIASERSNVSAVLYNRLNQKMKLQVDATSYYVERYIKPYIIGDINRYNNYYNTYKCTALPAGPICSPGLASIKAALSPNSTDALFFLSDEAGNYYYSTTYEEHLNKLEQIRINE